MYLAQMHEDIHTNINTHINTQTRISEHTPRTKKTKKHIDTYISAHNTHTRIHTCTHTHTTFSHVKEGFYCSVIIGKELIIIKLTPFIMIYIREIQLISLWMSDRRRRRQPVELLWPAFV